MAWWNRAFSQTSGCFTLCRWSDTSCILSCSVVSNSFKIPWTAAYQASLFMGVSRQECWIGCHFLLQGILLSQGLNLHLLCLLQVDSCTTEPPGKPHEHFNHYQTKMQRFLWWLIIWAFASITEDLWDICSLRATDIGSNIVFIQ